MSNIWSRLINLAGNITGTLTVPNGGTGAVTLASNGTLYGNGTSAVQALAVNSSATQKYLTQTSSGTPTWNPLTARTRTIYLTGSGTYTTPAGVVLINVVGVGGGGGGAGGGTSGGTNGTAGGNTTFGTSLLVANGGSGGGLGNVGGAGGTASLGSGPVGLAISGGSGSGILLSGATVGYPGGAGGNSFFGGGGGGGAGGTSTSAGLAAATNSGSGGGGGGCGAGVTDPGSGGGAGGFFDGDITGPSGSYAYAVGAAGSAGTAGATGSAGGPGSLGCLKITEYYQ